MDEYAGGWATTYVTSDKLLEYGLWKLDFCREDMEKIAAKDLHELMRAWENIHRYWVAEACVRTRLVKKESRWPGYYHKADYPDLKKEEERFVNLKYDTEKKDWEIIERPMIPIL